MESSVSEDKNGFWMERLGTRVIKTDWTGRSGIEKGTGVEGREEMG